MTGLYFYGGEWSVQNVTNSVKTAAAYATVQSLEVFKMKSG